MGFDWKGLLKTAVKAVTNVATQAVNGSVTTPEELREMLDNAFMSEQVNIVKAVASQIYDKVGAIRVVVEEISFEQFEAIEAICQSNQNAVSDMLAALNTNFEEDFSAILDELRTGDEAEVIQMMVKYGLIGPHQKETATRVIAEEVSFNVQEALEALDTPVMNA